MNQSVQARQPKKGEGENNSRAILTEEIVLEARKLHKPYSREHSARALAERFGVSTRTMHLAITGRRWKHLEARRSQ